MLVQVVQQLNRGAPLTLAASAFAWAESYLRLRHPQANPRARSRRAHLPLRPRRLLARARWREGAGDFRASNRTRVARSSPARNERLKGNSSAILHVRTAHTSSGTLSCKAEARLCLPSSSDRSSSSRISECRDRSASKHIETAEPFDQNREN